MASERPPAGLGDGGVGVVIPALNCERTIAAVVRGALAYTGEVVVVDDGSTDRTAELAQAAGARVVRHGRCRGKGEALKTGFSCFESPSISSILTIDGDGQHLSEEIPKLLAAAAANRGAVIIGARVLDGIEVAPIKLFGNRFANRWVEIACGARIPDTQSGFRVYPLLATRALGCRASRFAFETEVLIRATRAGVPIISVPVRPYYPPVAERVSHYRPFADTVRIILVVVGLMLRWW